MSQIGETPPTYTLSLTTPMSIFQLHCDPVEIPPIRDMFCATARPLNAAYFLEIHVLTLSYDELGVSELLHIRGFENC